MKAIRKERRRKEARQQLDLLPERIEELARCLTEVNGTPTPGGQTKSTGSAAPLRLDVVHLVDVRQKPGWEGEDPRLRQLEDRYGAAGTLAAWVRVIAEECPDVDQTTWFASADGEIEMGELSDLPTVATETRTLRRHWDWILTQQWVEELVDDILNLGGQISVALGIRRDYRPRCRYCKDNVVPVDDHGEEVSGWDQCAYGFCVGCGQTFPKGPALDALAKVQPPMPLKEIAEIIGVPEKTLHRWHNDGWISPAPESVGKRGRLFDLASVRSTATRIYRRATA